MDHIPFPDNEEQRIEVLKAFEILDSPAEALFDQLIDLAVEYFQVRIGFISLIDQNRQWFKAQHGISARQVSRENAFCSYTIINSDPLVVEDTLKDHRFMNNEWVVKDPSVRFYAGVPLTVAGDMRIGTLSILDTSPRTLSAEQLRALITFGAQAAELLESRLGRRQKRRTQEVIERQQRELEGSAKMATLGGLAAGIAHEINNPLSVILARARQLVDRAKQGPVDQSVILKNAEAIEKTGSRIAKTVHAIKTFSRNEDQDPFVAVPLRSIIEDTLELCFETYNNRSIEMRVRYPDASLKVECRQTELSQVLLNLFNNAFDAIEDSAEKWVALDYAEKGSMLEISVSDSGPEIPDAIRGKILEPFFTTKPPGKGTGLGLSISQKFVQGHGGSLELAPDLKTRFVIRLPLRHG